MKLRSQITITTILAVFIAAGWFWLAGDHDAAQSSEPPRQRSFTAMVLTEKIKFAEDTVVVRAIGIVKAIKSASIHPSVAGKVVEVTFQAGKRHVIHEVLWFLNEKELI